MDVNAGIIDQRVRQLVADHGVDWVGDDNKKRTRAFTLLCATLLLDLPPEEAKECLTDEGQDQDVDALYITDIVDGEFSVVLFQSKYKVSLDAQSAFPANAIQKLAFTIGALFDPDKQLTVNDSLRPKVEEIRSLIRDGNIPTVRVLLCNNGKPWDANGQEHIDRAAFGDRVSWEHVNHNRLVTLMQRQVVVDDTLRLDGKAIVEEFNFRRVLIGKIPASELHALMTRHGDRLLERNIRRYLGFNSNWVNLNISNTLRHEPSNVYFYNNGVTMVCSKFRHNALQGTNFQVQVEGLQIINGGQTCRTIQKTIDSTPSLEVGQAFVLLRLYEIDSTTDNLVWNITFATNSQNPVDMRDLRSNDEIQQRLEIAIKDLGYEYRRKRDDSTPAATRNFPSSVAAEAVFTVWRRKPHLAKFGSSKLFSTYYNSIFSQSLNGAQVVLAVLIFRMVENERKRPSTQSPPRFLPYASHFLAMLVGDYLLNELNVKVGELTHLNFASAAEYFEQNKAELYQKALAALTTALTALGVDESTSWQRLSATFRRGDLLETIAI